MNSTSLTVIILTFNEEKHIERCIKSIQNFATEIIVVDSYSTDRTTSLAESLGARVYKNKWVNHAVQFQWALDTIKIDTEWIMRLDADEYVETEFEDVIECLSELESNVNGLYIKRKYYFLGQWIKHGAMYPVYVLRIWKNGTGRMEQRWMDEHVVLTYGETVEVDIDIVDDNINSITWWIDKHNSYATKEMIELLNQKYNFMPRDNALVDNSNTQVAHRRKLKEGTYNHLPIFLRSLFYFTYRYFFKLGILDGKKGYAFHYMQGYWYRTLVDLKALEVENLIKNEVEPEKIKELIEEHVGYKISSI